MSQSGLAFTYDSAKRCFRSTSNPFLEYFVGEIDQMLTDLENYPRRLVSACGRCRVVCIGPHCLCKCCNQYNKANGYPDDGKRHERIIDSDAFKASFQDDLPWERSWAA
jgi:hypothetical protein